MISVLFTFMRRVARIVGEECIVVVVGGQLFSFGILVPVVFPAMKLSLPLMCVLASEQLTVFVLGSYFVSTLVSRYGARIPAVAGAATWNLGMYWFSTISDSVTPFAVLGGFMGLGGALCVWSISSPFHISAWTSAWVGAMIVSSTLPPVLTVAQWRETIALCSYVGGPTLLCAALLLESPFRDPETPRGKASSRMNLWLTKVSVACVSAAFFAPFILLTREGGVTYLVGITAAGCVLGGILSLLVSDWALHFVRALLLLLCVTCVGWIFCTRLDQLIAFAVFYGLGLGAVVPLAVSWLEREMEGDIRVAALVGLMSGMSLMGQIVAVSLVGAKAFIAVLYLVSFLAWMWIRPDPSARRVSTISQLELVPEAA